MGMAMKHPNLSEFRAASGIQANKFAGGIVFPEL